MLEEFPISLTLDYFPGSSTVHFLWARDRQSVLKFAEADWNVTMSNQRDQTGRFADWNLVADECALDELKPNLGCLSCLANDNSEEVKNYIVGNRPHSIWINGAELFTGTKTENGRARDWAEFLLKSRYFIYAVRWETDETVGVPFLKSSRHVNHENIDTLKNDVNLLAFRNYNALIAASAVLRYMGEAGMEKIQLLENIQALEKFADNQTETIMALQQTIADQAKAGPEPTSPEPTS